ncbi:hypothetical protein FRC08_014084 [Ceratobasidium sp. 394]|nr:hypothetical protein FRC08_014084 [Ceratobasidium sp. 394]KAG9082400.1 hypothetical protein FS749_006870 [Ceratobasidium sp. UAMH 11750]
MADSLPQPMAIDLLASPPTTADPLPRTYASVAVGATSEKSPPGPKPSHPSRPKSKGLGMAPARSAGPPVRPIIHLCPSLFTSDFPFAALFLKGPSEPFRLLSHALALNSSTRDVRLLGVHQNRSRNLVVSLAPGTSGADVARPKVLVSSVPTRTKPGAPVHSEADVQASFLSTNPAVSALKIARPPRWIPIPASITGAHSSFTFSFEDSDGSLARSLAKLSLFVFGGPVHLKRWTDKPLATRKETRRRQMAA